MVGGDRAQDPRATHLCAFPAPSASPASRGPRRRCAPATEGRARRVCPGETLDFSKDAGNTDSPVERSPSHISSPPRSLSFKVSAVDSSGPTWVTDTVHIFPPSLPSRALGDRRCRPPEDGSFPSAPAECGKRGKRAACRRFAESDRRTGRENPLGASGLVSAHGFSGRLPPAA